MRLGRYPSEGPFPPFVFAFYQMEEIKSPLASLVNEDIYDYLREHFDNSATVVLEDVNPEYLLQEDSLGQTMLHWAAVKGDEEVTKFIIEKTKGKLFSLKTTIDRYTALHLAVLGGNYKVVDLLVDASQEFGIIDFIGAADVHGQTALYIAAGKGKIDVCQKLYPKMSTAEISFQIKGRLQTALHLAVQGSHKQVVELLLSKDEVAKEILGKVDQYGQSVLHWAAGKPSDQGKELVDLLIQKALTLPPNLRKDFFFTRKYEGYTALHLAVHSDSNESVKSLVNATKDHIPEFISAVDQYEQTPLHWAAGKGNLVASTYLCDAMEPEDINIQVKDRQQTALHFAVQGGHIDVIKLLIARGANTNLKDVNGWTALDWAQKYLNTESKEAIIAFLT